MGVRTESSSGGGSSRPDALDGLLEDNLRGTFGLDRSSVGPDDRVRSTHLWQENRFATVVSVAPLQRKSTRDDCTSDEFW